ncbi:hypothetical protein M9H77_14093 [Catharanthus roseus]|uniref:Uncharacterized protein n=1 Tax=Catharanthus roseus TaxID=4058 RepID=A0ACC0BM24_CATRO|nr:hypothetical protein M9H77_14093 [Catharanthus roseus]
MGSGSPIDDLIESGTIRLLDWNDFMTDIQLGMRFVDKVQIISAVLVNDPEIPMSNVIQEVQCVEKMGQEQILMYRRFATNVKFGTIDAQNKICKFTIIEGEYQGNKVNESITVEEIFEPSNNRGCVIRTKTNFRPMAAQNYPKTALNATGDIMALSMSMLKAGKAFVLANPAICA